MLLARAVASQPPAAGVGSDLHTPQIQAAGRSRITWRAVTWTKANALWWTSGIANLQDGQRKSGSPIGEAVTKGEAADLLTSASVALSGPHCLEYAWPELIAAVELGEIALSTAAPVPYVPRTFMLFPCSPDFPDPALGSRRWVTWNTSRGDRTSTRAFCSQKPRRSPMLNVPAQEEERYKAFYEWRRASVWQLSHMTDRI